MTKIYTVDSLYSGHYRDLGLVSSLARVRNRGEISCSPYYISVSVIAEVRKARVDCILKKLATMCDLALKNKAKAAVFCGSQRLARGWIHHRHPALELDNE